MDFEQNIDLFSIVPNVIIVFGRLWKGHSLLRFFSYQQSLLLIIYHIFVVNYFLHALFAHFVFYVSFRDGHFFALLEETQSPYYCGPLPLVSVNPMQGMLRNPQYFSESVGEIPQCL